MTAVLPYFAEGWSQNKAWRGKVPHFSGCVAPLPSPNFVRHLILTPRNKIFGKVPNMDGACPGFTAPF
jgi:hypothetical protein